MLKQFFQNLTSARNIPLNVWTTGFVPRTVLYSLKCHPFLVGPMIFTYYWIVPLFLNLLQGTLIPPHFQEFFPSQLFPWPLLSTLLSEISAPAPVILSTGYFNDLSHFLFSISIACGGIAVAFVLTQYYSVLQELLSLGVLTLDRNEVDSIYCRYRRTANHWVFRIASLSFASVSIVSISTFSIHSRYSFWWGSIQHGYAGIYLALAVAVTVYYGTQAAYQLTVGALMYRKILANPLRPRMFHSDGCNGLGALGRLVFDSWIVALFAATALTVTLFLGYLGIEKQIFVWILAIGALVAIPSVAVVPLIASIRSLQAARRAKIDKLEILLRSLFDQLEILVESDRADEALAVTEKIEKLRTAYGSVYQMHIWPFNTKALGLVIGAYVGQVSITVGKFIIG